VLVLNRFKVIKRVGEHLRQTTKRIGVATLFGVAMFVTTTFVPSPMDKMFVAVQAVFLGLGALLLRKLGATYVAVVGGILAASWRGSFAPFTFLFAIIFGLIIDTTFLAFKIYPAHGEVRMGRIVASLTLSTALVGSLSYYVTVILLDLLPRNLILEATIMVVGTLNGIIAGYLVSVIWNKYLKSIVP
jgi:hypothetical protein